MDAQGPLPPDAYCTLTSSSPYVKNVVIKPTSRIQMAWDVSRLSSPHDPPMISSYDVKDMVSNMQSAIDHGISTFQLKSESTASHLCGPHDQIEQSLRRSWGETNLYGSLIRNTPRSVIDHCQLIVPLYLQDVLCGFGDNENRNSHSQLVSTKSIRKAVTEKLRNMQCDSIDNVQIRFPTSLPQYTARSSERRTWLQDKVDSSQDNNYYLDLLDGLRDLQREGFVRSITSAGISVPMFRQAQSAGLIQLIDTNQINTNLLRPTSWVRTEDCLSSSTKGTSQPPWTVVSSALAGGWLTDRHVGNCRIPQDPSWLQRVSPQERYLWETHIVQAWGTKHLQQSDQRMDNGKIWQVYQSKILDPLRDIANKHGVSVASVVLRWTLRMNEAVASSVVTCRILPFHCYEWQRRQQHTDDSSLGDCTAAAIVSARAKQLRQVFKFDLDDDDMARMWELAGPIDYTNEQSEQGDVETGWSNFSTLRTRNGLLIPDRID